MECLRFRHRRPHFVGGLLLGLLSGCTFLQPTPPPPGPVEWLSQEEVQKNRKPKPETCVACAEMRLAAAASPDKTAAEIERLRDEARRAYQQALKINKKHLPAYFGLAKLYEDMGEHDRAIATYQAALKVHPKEGTAWYTLGMCHARHKEWEPALVSLRKAIEQEPENHLYLNILGFCLARSGQFDESFTFFAKTQGEAKAHYNVARMLHHVQRDDECREHLRLALLAKPDLAPAQEMLAQLNQPAGVSPAAALGQVEVQPATP